MLLHTVVRLRYAALSEESSAVSANEKPRPSWQGLSVRSSLGRGRLVDCEVASADPALDPALDALCGQVVLLGCGQQRPV